MRFKSCRICLLAVFACLRGAVPAAAQQEPPGHSLFVKGEHALEARRYPEAIQDFTRSLQLGDTGAVIYEQRSEAYAQWALSQHDPQAMLTHAVDDLQKAQDLGIETGQSGQSLDDYAHGLIQSATGGTETEAEADFTSAIRLDPPCAEAVYARGIVRYKMGKRSLAVQDMKQAALLYQLTNDISNERLAKQRLAQFQHGGSR